MSVRKNLQDEIIEVLNSINYSLSRLPSEVLDYKSDDSQRNGDYEQIAEYCIHCIEMCHIDPNKDVLNFDKCLKELAERYSTAVSSGSIKAAHYSVKGLLRCTDIRCKNFPKVSDDDFYEYNKYACEYIETWLTIVRYAERYDSRDKELKIQKNIFDSQASDYFKLREEIKKLILNLDSEAGEDYRKIYVHDSLQERLSWTQNQREAHNKVVSLALKNLSLNYLEHKLQAEEKNHIIAQECLMNMYVYITNMDIDMLFTVKEGSGFQNESFLSKSKQLEESFGSDIGMMAEEINRILNYIIELL